MRIISVRELLLHKTAPLYPFAFALLAILWGIWLLLPFDVFATSPSYSFASHYVTETVLGSIALFIGLVQIVMVIVRKTRYVSWTGIAHFHFWLFIFFSFVLSNWENPGVLVYGWIALMNGLGYINWKVQQVWNDRES